MGKHTDALKPFDEFRAPWETADGSEAEIDKAKAESNQSGPLAEARARQEVVRASTETAELEALKAEKVLESEIRKMSTRTPTTAPATMMITRSTSAITR